MLRISRRTTAMANQATSNVGITSIRISHASNAGVRKSGRRGNKNGGMKSPKVTFTPPPKCAAPAGVENEIDAGKPASFI